MKLTESQRKKVIKYAKSLQENENTLDIGSVVSSSDIKLIQRGIAGICRDTEGTFEGNSFTEEEVERYIIGIVKDCIDSNLN